MQKHPESPLVCPVCQSPLQLTERSYHCAQNHCFDQARQGYLNLLLSHQKRSKQPGDNQLMVAARSHYLNQGHYRPIYDALEKTCLSHIQTAPEQQTSPFQMLDLGCGEGYYTHLLHQKLCEISPTESWGVDISKPAILNACKRSKELNWLVANLTHLPFADHSIDLICTLFCRITPAEIARLLKPEGYFILAKPTARHLVKLRELVYPHLKNKISNTDTPTEEQAVKASSSSDLSQLKRVDTQSLTCPLILNKPEDIQALFKMTPHYWHTSPEGQQNLAQLKCLETEISVEFFVYQRQKN